ncbi:unnamed protein product [Kuraishia capsulata CBS 1993]|uniref:Uncharacterized protein n=1 Tax=Kuraishia capsulata CBS 1993 TaxID=1382522 RepID=W6MWG2_9ASCO|nr:uncharacterized protein KUCA_T00003368001 [Kuraishia capsulata CBS 1993]CDK27390.1 unnamed protein product [Kuraishia capsulata CBS 1993]
MGSHNTSQSSANRKSVGRGNKLPLPSQYSFLNTTRQRLFKSKNVSQIRKSHNLNNAYFTSPFYSALLERSRMHNSSFSGDATLNTSLLLNSSRVSDDQHQNLVSWMKSLKTRADYAKTENILEQKQFTEQLHLEERQNNLKDHIYEDTFKKLEQELKRNGLLTRPRNAEDNVEEQTEEPSALSASQPVFEVETSKSPEYDGEPFIEEEEQEPIVDQSIDPMFDDCDSENVDINVEEERSSPEAPASEDEVIVLGSESDEAPEGEIQPNLEHYDEDLETESQRYQSWHEREESEEDSPEAESGRYSDGYADEDEEMDEGSQESPDDEIEEEIQDPYLQLYARKADTEYLSSMGTTTGSSKKTLEAQVESSEQEEASDEEQRNEDLSEANESNEQEEYDDQENQMTPENEELEGVSSEKELEEDDLQSTEQFLSAIEQPIPNTDSFMDIANSALGIETAQVLQNLSENVYDDILSNKLPESLEDENEHGVESPQNIDPNLHAEEPQEDAEVADKSESENEDDSEGSVENFVTAIDPVIESPAGPDSSFESSVKHDTPVEALEQHDPEEESLVHADAIPDTDEYLLEDDSHADMEDGFVTAIEIAPKEATPEPQPESEPPKTPPPPPITESSILGSLVKSLERHFSDPSSVSVESDIRLSLPASPLKKFSQNKRAPSGLSTSFTADEPDLDDEFNEQHNVLSEFAKKSGSEGETIEAFTSESAKAECEDVGVVNDEDTNPKDADLNKGNVAASIQDENTSNGEFEEVGEEFDGYVTASLHQNDDMDYNGEDIHENVENEPEGENNNQSFETEHSQNAEEDAFSESGFIDPELFVSAVMEKQLEEGEDLDQEQEQEQSLEVFNTGIEDPIDQEDSILKSSNILGDDHSLHEFHTALEIDVTGLENLENHDDAEDDPKGGEVANEQLDLLKFAEDGENENNEVIETTDLQQLPAISEDSQALDQSTAVVASEPVDIPIANENAEVVDDGIIQNDNDNQSIEKPDAAPSHDENTPSGDALDIVDKDQEVSPVESISEEADISTSSVVITPPAKPVNPEVPEERVVSDEPQTDSEAPENSVTDASDSEIRGTKRVVSSDDNTETPKKQRTECSVSSSPLQPFFNSIKPISKTLFSLWRRSTTPDLQPETEVIEVINEPVKSPVRDSTPIQSDEEEEQQTPEQHRSDYVLDKKVKLVPESIDDAVFEKLRESTRKSSKRSISTAQERLLSPKKRSPSREHKNDDDDDDNETLHVGPIPDLNPESSASSSIGLTSPARRTRSRSQKTLGEPFEYRVPEDAELEKDIPTLNPDQSEKAAPGVSDSPARHTRSRDTEFEPVMLDESNHLRSASRGARSRSRKRDIDAKEDENKAEIDIEPVITRSRSKKRNVSNPESAASQPKTVETRSRSSTRKGGIPKTNLEVSNSSLDLKPQRMATRSKTRHEELEIAADEPQDHPETPVKKRLRSRKTESNDDEAKDEHDAKEEEPKPQRKSRRTRAKKTVN